MRVMLGLTKSLRERGRYKIQDVPEQVEGVCVVVHEEGLGAQREVPQRLLIPRVGVLRYDPGEPVLVLGAVQDGGCFAQDAAGEGCRGVQDEDPGCVSGEVFEGRLNVKVRGSAGDEHVVLDLPLLLVLRQFSVGEREGE